MSRPDSARLTVKTRLRYARTLSSCGGQQDHHCCGCGATSGLPHSSRSATAVPMAPLPEPHPGRCSCDHTITCPRAGSSARTSPAGLAATSAAKAKPTSTKSVEPLRCIEPSPCYDPTGKVPCLVAQETAQVSVGGLHVKKSDVTCSRVWSLQNRRIVASVAEIVPQRGPPRVDEMDWGSGSPPPWDFSFKPGIKLNYHIVSAEG